MPQDFLKNDITEGDTVVFGRAQHMNLCKGKVIKINAKTVKIEHEEYDPYDDLEFTVHSQRTFDNVVVVAKND